MIRPEDAGRWEGDTFVFDPPLTFTEDDGTVAVIKVLCLSGMVLGEGITPYDVIHTLLNPVHVRDQP